MHERAVAARLLQLAAREFLLQTQPVRRRTRDVEVHLAGRLDRRERGGLFGGHERAFGDARFADASGDRRDHFGVAEVDRRGLQCGAVGEHIGLRLVERGDGVVVVLAAHALDLRQFRVTRRLGLRGVGGRHRFGERADGLVVRGLVAGRVDLIEHGAGRDQRAFGEKALPDDAFDLRPDFGDANRRQTPR
jgi:hypothetical protein